MAQTTERYVAVTEIVDVAEPAVTRPILVNLDFVAAIYVDVNGMTALNFGGGHVRFVIEAPTDVIAAPAASDG